MLEDPELRLTGSVEHWKQIGTNRLLRTKGVLEEQVEIPWVMYGERVALTGPFLTPTCDACSGPLPGKGGQLLKTEYSVVLDARPQERNVTLVCQACRDAFLQDRRRWLEPLEDFAATFWRQTQKSRRETLEQLGAPYTPKAK